MLILGAIALPTGFFGGVVDIVFKSVSCIGTESSLLDCVGNSSSTACDSMEDAAIICQGNCVIVDC